MALPGEEDEQRRRFRQAFEAAGLALEQVWMAYFGIGGMSGLMEVQAYVHGALRLPALERDLLAHALNETLDELGLDTYHASYSHEVFGREDDPTKPDLDAIADDATADADGPSPRDDDEASDWRSDS
ncbi:hypothetical protein [Arthrobacter sp. M4]|uniref:hypothetical protein n=1 Tax=Arthrobacter sp. M4 TaxID=218160 RepID=UPI001CDBE081|nr:hypothetical protein [Arthrobacter sp. M4]MCA4135191.1 hypothetical protein [Arthrobacter sp. M4]